MYLLTAWQVKNLMTPQPKCQRLINLYKKTKKRHYFGLFYKAKEMLIVYAIMIKSQIQQILKKDKKKPQQKFPLWLPLA